MKILIDRVNPSVKLPTKATPGSAGFDLYLPIDIFLTPGEVLLVDMGFRLVIPQGYFGLIVPRSGLGASGIILRNTVGVIDSDYRNTIKIVLTNQSSENFDASCGSRVAQLLILPVMSPEIIEGSIDPDETRQGFGSTGV